MLLDENHVWFNGYNLIDIFEPRSSDILRWVGLILYTPAHKEFQLWDIILLGQIVSKKSKTYFRHLIALC